MIKQHPDSWLLVPMAIMYAERGEKKTAEENAEAALECLERFAPPAGMSEQQWKPVFSSLREAATRLAVAGRPSPAERRKPDPTAAYAGSASCAIEVNQIGHARRCLGERCGGQRLVFCAYADC